MLWRRKSRCTGAVRDAKRALTRSCDFHCARRGVQGAIWSSLIMVVGFVFISRIIPGTQ